MHPQWPKINYVQTGEIRKLKYQDIIIDMILIAALFYWRNSIICSVLKEISEKLIILYHFILEILFICFFFIQRKGSSIDPVFGTE